MKKCEVRALRCAVQCPQSTAKKKFHLEQWLSIAPLWLAATSYTPLFSPLRGGGWWLPSWEQRMESPSKRPIFRSRNSWITGEASQTKTLCQCFHINRKAPALFISTRTFPEPEKPRTSTPALDVLELINTVQRTNHPSERQNPKDLLLLTRLELLL